MKKRSYLQTGTQKTEEEASKHLELLIFVNKSLTQYSVQLSLSINFDHFNALEESNNKLVINFRLL